MRSLLFGLINTRRNATAVVALTSAAFFLLYEFFEKHFLISNGHSQIEDLTAIVFYTTFNAVVAWILIGKLLQARGQVEQHRLSIARHETHQATMVATYHYLNNTLNQFQAIIMSIREGEAVDPGLIGLIEKEMDKTVRELMELGQMDDVSRKTVDQFIQDRLARG